MEVQDRRLGHLVAEDDAHVVSGVDADLRTRHRPVEAHRVNEHAGLGLPPDLLGRELEDLDPVLDRRFERLVALGVGLGREGLDALPVAVEHLLDAHPGMRTAGTGGAARPGCHDRAGLNHERADHPGSLVSWDRAVRLVVAGRERRNLQRDRVARLDLRRVLNTVLGIDRERVRGRAIVRHRERERQSRGGVDHRRRDRELRQRDREGRGHRRVSLCGDRSSLALATARRGKERNEQDRGADHEPADVLEPDHRSLLLASSQGTVM